MDNLVPDGMRKIAVDQDTLEMELLDGRRVGSRVWAKYYKQNLRAPDERESVRANKLEALRRLVGPEAAEEALALQRREKAGPRADGATGLAISGRARDHISMALATGKARKTRELTLGQHT